MKIEVNLHIKDLDKTICLDLSDWIGTGYDGFIEAIYTELNIVKPIDCSPNGIEVVDTEFFNSIDEVETFLENDFDGSDVYPSVFLAWVNAKDKPFDAVVEFEESFEGFYSSSEDFSKNQADACGDLHDVSYFIKDNINWSGVWRTHYINEYFGLTVEDPRDDSDYIKTTAFFRRLTDND